MRYQNTGKLLHPYGRHMFSYWNSPISDALTQSLGHFQTTPRDMFTKPWETVRYLTWWPFRLSMCKYILIMSHYATLPPVLSHLSSLQYFSILARFFFTTNQIQIPTISIKGKKIYERLWKQRNFITHKPSLRKAIQSIKLNKGTEEWRKIANLDACGNICLMQHVIYSNIWVTLTYKQRNKIINFLI